VIGLLHRISWGNLAALAIAACFLAVALYHGLHTMRDLAWHPGNDAYRDIALAQIILDGDYPADGLAAGEWLWYNPLTGALVAAAARIAEMPPPLADIRMGPYINLLVPASFFLLAWYLADIWVALAALVSFIFILPQDRPSFVTAGYSPWLLAPHLTQALFYGTLLVWARYLKCANGWTAAGAGLLLGITFLGHTAPAVLLGTIMVATDLWRPHASPARWRHLGVALLVAFVTSLPFTISILFRYRLNIVHSTPTEWIWEGAALENLPSTLAGLIHWQTAVMLVGFGFVAFGNTQRHIKSIAVAWPAAAFLFLAYSYLAQWAARHGIGLRQINPGYHYVLYVIAAGHFYFGAGVVALTDLASRLSPLASRLSPLASRLSPAV
jgi:hypothetical protein